MPSLQTLIVLGIFLFLLITMTAFEEVMKVEQEVEKAINETKEEVAKAISVAKTEQQKRVKATVSQLEEAERTALDKQDKDIDKKVIDISADANSRIAAFKEMFGSKRTELKATILRAFE